MWLGSGQDPIVVALLTRQAPELVYPKALYPGVDPRTPSQIVAKSTNAILVPILSDIELSPVKTSCLYPSLADVVVPRPVLSTTSILVAKIGEDVSVSSS